MPGQAFSVVDVAPATVSERTSSCAPSGLKSRVRDPRTIVIVKRKGTPGPKPVPANADHGTATSTDPGGPPEPPLAPGFTAGGKSQSVVSVALSGGQPVTLIHGVVGSTGSAGVRGRMSCTASPAPTSHRLKSNTRRKSALPSGLAWN